MSVRDAKEVVKSMKKAWGLFQWYKHDRHPAYPDGAFLQDENETSFTIANLSGEDEIDKLHKLLSDIDEHFAEHTVEAAVQVLVGETFDGVLSSRVVVFRLGMQRSSEFIPAAENLFISSDSEVSSTLEGQGDELEDTERKFGYDVEIRGPGWKKEESDTWKNFLVYLCRVTDELLGQGRNLEVVDYKPKRMGQPQNDEEEQEQGLSDIWGKVIVSNRLDPKIYHLEQERDLENKLQFQRIKAHDLQKDLSKLMKEKNKRTVVVVGETGSGKSHTVNKLLKYWHERPLDPESMAEESNMGACTSRIQCYQAGREEEIDVYDTPGLLDEYGRDDLFITQLRDLCRELGQVSVIVLCLHDIERLRMPQQGMIKSYSDVIGHRLGSRVIVIANRSAATPTNAMKTKKGKAIKMILKSYNPTNIFECTNDNVEGDQMFLGMVNTMLGKAPVKAGYLDALEGMLQQIADSRTTEGKEKYLNSVLEDSYDFVRREIMATAHSNARMRVSIGDKYVLENGAVRGRDGLKYVDQIILSVQHRGLDTIWSTGHLPKRGRERLLKKLERHIKKRKLISAAWLGGSTTERDGKLPGVDVVRRRHIFLLGYTYGNDEALRKKVLDILNKKFTKDKFMERPMHQSHESSI